MSNTQYTNDIVSVKKVYYTGSDELKEGYALCYDRDVTGDGAGEIEDLRAVYVEQPASGNLEHFAGFVGPSGEGVTGPAWIDIKLPADGLTALVWTDISCTIDTTYLSLQASSYALGDNTEGRIVAKAIQTIDRSSTAGTCQAIIGGLDTSEVITAAGRAATALPTAAIWDNFPLATMRANPMYGTLLEVDFRKAGEVPDQIFQTDTTAAVSHLNTAVIGELLLFTSADNEEAAILWNTPIAVSGGNPWGFEIRLKVENITDARATCVAGLGFSRTLAGDVVADDGAALTDGDFVGIVRFAADGDIWDFIYDEGSQTTNVHDDDYITAAADTYVTFGMHFNGTTIQGYVNGTSTGTAISAADIAAADFPTAAVVVPILAVKGDNAADFDFTVDWIRVAQI